MTGTTASFSDTGGVASLCGPDSDAGIPGPIFGDAASYYVPAITAYDKNGNSIYRIANATDFGGNANTADKSIALLVNGSDLQANPVSCLSAGTCALYNKAVKLKLNVAYKQPMNTRNKDQSKDVWLDLRTGNVEVKDPVSP